MIPAEMTERGLWYMHNHPLVVDDKEEFYKAYRVAPEVAWGHRYIEIHPEHAYTCIVLDVDDVDKYESAKIHLDVPEPHWETYNPESGHLHIGYILMTPVKRSGEFSHKALNYYADVTKNLTLVSGADLRFNNIYTYSPYYKGFRTTWSVFTEPYELYELEVRVPKYLKVSSVETGIGRNVDLYEKLIKDAHKPKWGRTIQGEGIGSSSWFEYAMTTNELLFEYPLGYSEVKSIAQSTARYSSRQFSEEVFSQIQTARINRRWGDRTERDKNILELRAKGLTYKQIVAELSVSEKTISKVISSS